MRPRWLAGAIVACFMGVVVGVAPGDTNQLSAPVAAPPSPPPTPLATPAPTPAPTPAERRVEYAVSEQRVWLYEGDREVGTWLVSGRRGVPRPGEYRVRSRSRWSSRGSVRMEYMVRFAPGRNWWIGFHSIPVTASGRPIQSEAELGRYRSHGCVRQRLADAARMWDFAQLGTRVTVRA